MSIIQTIRNQVTTYMRAKTDSEKIELLRLVIGTAQQTNNESDDNVTSIIRKLIKSNNESISSLSDDQEKIQKLKAENELLDSFLAATLSEDDITSIIKTEKIDVYNARNAGAAIGLVMNYLKSINKSALGETVKNVVLKERGQAKK